jgi:hypothetical protein
MEMEMSDQHDGNLIERFGIYQTQLNKLGLTMDSWGRICVYETGNRGAGYVLNNVTNIDVVEGFIEGIKYMNVLADQDNKD